MEEITRIEIPNYIRQIKLSNARNPKYFELVNGKLKGGKAGKLPVKYTDTKTYAFKPVRRGKKMRTFLVNIKTGELIISNPKACGTPRIYTINGQDLYNSNIGSHTRNKIQHAIKASFQPYLLRMEPILKEQYPLIIKLEVHDLIVDPMLRNQAWDMDNRAQGWYVKCFQDLLKKEGKIIDDDVRYITGPPAPLFFPITDSMERKLVFVLYKDTRDIISNNDYYKI